MGGSMCMPCSDGGVGNTDGRKDASAVLRGVFAPTGSMGVARYDSTATLLGNGKVLVAGGLNPELGSSGKLRIAEVYDPAAGAFAATGSMSVGRTVPTATLLPSGKVLIAGEGSAELYDPSAGTFAATGSMTVARESHTATLLPNGLVLIAGGDYGNVSLASAELYDPSAGTFAATGSMTMARESHTATLLPSGMVLVAGGGAYGVGYLASAELFDPAARTFATTGSMTVARQSPTATLLGSGKVLIAGGIGGVGIGGGVGPLATADLFDPAARTFATTGSMTVARYGHTATLLESGMVLIVGGSAYGDGVLGSAELFDPVAGTFAATGSMIAARYGHTTTLLQSGIVLVAGGAGVVVAGSRYLTSAELYQ